MRADAKPVALNPIAAVAATGQRSATTCWMSFNHVLRRCRSLPVCRRSGTGWRDACRQLHAKLTCRTPKASQDKIGASPLQLSSLSIEVGTQGKTEGVKRASGPREYDGHREAKIWRSGLRDSR